MKIWLSQRRFSELEIYPAPCNQSHEHAKRIHDGRTLIDSSSSNQPSSEKPICEQNFCQDSNYEKGSAVAEFVLMATPLFIPALLFFNAMQSVAKEEANISHLARQAVRLFVTAEDHQTGHQRVRFLLDEFANLENKGRSSANKRYGFTYNITCSAEKCLTPGALVELELFRVVNQPIVPIQANGLDVDRERKSSAVARSYVDKWRESS